MSPVRVRLLTFRKVLWATALASLIALPAVKASTGEIPITSSSKEALQLFEQGRDSFDNVEIAEAAPLFDQAIQKDPGFALAYAYRALSGGDYPAFRKNIDKAVAMADKVSPGERHVILAMKAQADGDPATQKTHLDQLKTLFPTDKRVHTQLGLHAAFVLADNKQALVHYRKAVALDPTYGPAYNLIGYSETALRNYSAAEEAFKKYIALRPKRPNPYDSYAELLMKLGRFDESIAQYKKALAVDPSFTISFNGIGNNYVFKRAFAEARDAYEKQFQNASTPDGRVAALMATAASYVHEGNTPEALKTVERVRALAEKERLTPAVVGAHRDAAFILAEAGRSDEALKHMDAAGGALKASSLPPAVQEQGRLGDHLARALILADQKQFDAAKAEVQKAAPGIEKSNDPPLQRFHHQTLGLLALEQGRHTEALEHLSKADPNSPYVMFHTGIAHEKLGHSAEAAKVYKDVAGWNSNSLEYAFVRARAMSKIGKT